MPTKTHNFASGLTVPKLSKSTVAVPVETAKPTDFGREVKCMKIILKSAPAIAPRGKQAGTFIEARQDSGKPSD
jgi:hypothetical protein